MTTRRSRLTALPLTIAAGALLLSACGSTSSSGEASAADEGATDGSLSVVAAFYPLEYAAGQVGGDAVSITSLTPPGVEPHDLELTAAQVAEIAAADLVLYIKGFQPAVDEAIAQQAADRAIDVSSGLTLLAGEAHSEEEGEAHSEGEEAGHSDEEGANDPHVWLDPANMAAIGTLIGERIAELSPDAAATVEGNSAAFAQAMNDLDARFAEGLAQCASRDLVVSHEAFGYLAEAYGLTQVGISGLSPEAEPSPARMREVADLVRANDISTIYYETLVDPKVAQTIADETGAQTAVLDPLEGLVEGSTGDYSSVMADNLATLIAGQSCT
jgi:zinc transport system substrate-binding protein